MKKILIFLSMMILISSILSGCGDRKSEDVTTTTAAPTTEESITIVGDTYVTTEAKYTVGNVETSRKFETKDNEYEISYYDANGFAVKLEVYRDGKLRYYYTATSVDETGNCIQQKYYTPNGKLIGTFDNGFFFNANGEQITEDMMQKEIDKYK